MIGCAPSVYISKNYSGIDFSGRNLNIAVVGNLRIDYTGDMQNEFPAENRADHIRQYVTEAISKVQKASSVFANVSALALKCDSLKKWDMKWKDQTKLRFALPTDKCDLSSDTQAVWLLLENVKIESKPWVQIIMYTFIPVGAIPHKPLTITSDFIYWDPARKKPIAWGKAMGKHDAGFAVTIRNWDLASKQFGFSTIKGTPFKKN